MTKPIEFGLCLRFVILGDGAAGNCPNLAGRIRTCEEREVAREVARNPGAVLLIPRDQRQQFFRRAVAIQDQREHMNREIAIKRVVGTARDFDLTREREKTGVQAWRVVVCDAALGNALCDGNGLVPCDWYLQLQDAAYRDLRIVHRAGSSAACFDPRGCSP